MVAALKFFLGQDQAAEDESDDDDDEEFKAVQPSKAEVYKANSKVRVMMSTATTPLSYWDALCMLGATPYQKGVESRTDCRSVCKFCYTAAAGHQEQQEEEASQAEEGDGHSEEAGSQGKLQPARQFCCCAAAQRSPGVTLTHSPQ